MADGGRTRCRPPTADAVMRAPGYTSPFASVSRTDDRIRPRSATSFNSAAPAHLHARERGLVARIARRRRDFLDPGAHARVREGRVVAPAGIVTDAGKFAFPFGACNAIGRSTAGAVCTAIVAVPLPPCDDPRRRKQRELQRAPQRRCPPTARFDDAFAKKASNCCRYVSTCARSAADGFGARRRDEDEREAEAPLRDGVVRRAAAHRLDHLADRDVPPRRRRSATPRAGCQRLQVRRRARDHERVRDLGRRAEAHQVLIERRVALHRVGGEEARR